jgi:opacity protein-like surface antigen
MQAFFKPPSPVVLGLGMLLVASLHAAVQAEPLPWDLSLSIFGGYSVPFSTDVKITDPAAAADLTATGARLTAGLSVGGKLTAWRRRGVRGQGPDLGLELDVTRFGPDLRSQTTAASGIIAGNLTTQATLTEVELDTTIVAINLLARFPMSVRDDLPNGRWYPYVGIGAGAAVTSAKSVVGISDTSTEPAFQFLGGIKYFVTSHVGIFAEYKFTHASHEFRLATTREQIIINASHLVVGLAAHY